MSDSPENPRPDLPAHTPEERHLAEILEAPAYHRERWEPAPGDTLYLALSDLRKALEPFRSDDPLKILDYGCGCSPYRDLFRNADYRRAEFAAASRLDYEIVEGRPLPESDGTFDLVLSTQVLEHTRDPSPYLADCFRLLKPGGRLVLSTHGAFPDHGCPRDYQRWTADGLQRDLRSAGFSPVSLFKLTAGPRAALFFFERFSDQIPATKAGIPGFLAACAGRLIRKRRTRFHCWVDRISPENRVVSGEVARCSFYIGLMAAATKPGP